MTESDRRSPLDGSVLLETPTLSILELPFLPKTNVRPNAAAFVGIELPTTPNTIVRSGDATAIWLGPDEWLVVGLAVAGIDVSAQYTTIVLNGPATRDVLAHGCALDLSPDAGWCAQTTIARANAVLVGMAPDEIHLHVRASFARYLAAWLYDAGSPIAAPPL